MRWGAILPTADLYARALIVVKTDFAAGRVGVGGQQAPPYLNALYSYGSSQTIGPSVLTLTQPSAKAVPDPHLSRSQFQRQDGIEVKGGE